MLGGNGPDYLALRNAEEIQSGMIQGGSNQDSSVQFLAGDLFNSPPLFMPGTGEIFQPANQARESADLRSKKSPVLLRHRAF